MLKHPLCVYINWSAYDEISDTVELTEELAMREMDHFLRLRDRGVRLDCYLMDCYWFANDGGYRAWRTPHWPDGPDAWLRRCAETGVIPGLWFGTNDLGPMTPVPEWQDSVDTHARAMCMFEGGFLPHFMDSLALWYERGIRVFKFDFVNFDAVPDRLRASLLPSEIRAANVSALRGALAAFRAERPDAVLLGYNGFDEIPIQGFNSLDVRRAVDIRWLEVFDSLYCGDPRLSDVPTFSFWRSKDVYSDHQVRYYEAMGFPLERIDSSGFMIGNTGACYYRKAAGWKGMLLLALARGGWMNTYYGELERLSDDDAAWFARAQSLHLPLQANGRISTFGPLPATGEPYGFAASGTDGSLYTVVNPAQRIAAVDLPAGAGRVLFHDAGFTPAVEGSRLTLGPEQMAVVGTGDYASPEHDLGVQDDVIVPAAIRRLEVDFVREGNNLIATFPAPAGDLRFVVRQSDAKGTPVRTTGGPPPNGIPMGSVLRLEAEQAGRAVPVRIAYDRPIWSGLSWAAGEIAATDLAPGAPVTIRFTTPEPSTVQLAGEAWEVR